VRELTLLSGVNDEYTLHIKCTAGTYVRALIHDIGHELGSGAVMTALHRTHSGPFCIDDAVAVEEVTRERVITINNEQLATNNWETGERYG
jgi:tRNA pseudouridine55 synthase